MEPTSSSSEKKSETNLSDLTDHVVFKGSNLTSKNLNKSNYITKTIHKSNNTILLKKEGLDNLSFRTNEGKKQKSYENYPDYLNQKVRNLLNKHLISNEDNDKINTKESIEDLKKIFVKNPEKEIEIFDTDRALANELSKKENNYTIKKKNTIDQKEKETSNEKYLSKVICTLSKIENGFATFVSDNDLIFVLPTLFIPKNLNVGNSYVFKLCEIDQAQDKIVKVNSIHEKYTQE